MQDLNVDYFLTNETKLDDSFPSCQFYLNSYVIRARRDREKYARGLIEYVNKGFACSRKTKYEPGTSE